MQIPQLPLTPEGALLIDNSGFVESASTCGRALQYKILHGRILDGEKPSLHFGSAIHLANELRYKRYAHLPVASQYFTDLNSVLEKHYEGASLPDGDWRTMSWASRVMEEYLMRYPQEAFTLVPLPKPTHCRHCKDQNGVSLDPEAEGCVFCNNEPLTTFVETPYILPLGDVKYPSGAIIPVFYIGKIDVVMYDDAGVWVMDHKTTSMMGTPFWNGMSMTAQMRGYCWAYYQVTGEMPRGYVVNAIRTKDAPQYVLNNDFKPGRKTQNPQEWWNESFARQRFYLKPGELDEWKQDVLSMIETTFDRHSRGYFPKQTQWCSSYSGCPYMQVCQLVSEDRERMLMSEVYTDNVWSPLNPVVTYEKKTGEVI